MRYALATLLFLHGIIHLMGVAKAFNWGNMSAIHQPISRTYGLAWMLATVLLVSAAGLLFADKHWWWVVAIIGAALSQWLIHTVWNDARFGTVANIAILLPLLMAATGHLNLR